MRISASQGESGRASASQCESVRPRVTPCGATATSANVCARAYLWHRNTRMHQEVVVAKKNRRQRLIEDPGPARDPLQMEGPAPLRAGRAPIAVFRGHFHPAVKLHRSGTSVRRIREGPFLAAKAPQRSSGTQGLGPGIGPGDGRQVCTHGCCGMGHHRSRTGRVPTAPSTGAFAPFTCVSTVHHR